MTPPDGLAPLVQRFTQNLDDYMSSRFNETQTRIDFIDPLLGLLGWDVNNVAGQPEAYREIVHEDRIRVGGGTKAPDYGFYLGGDRQFFLEAKKPSVNIRNSINAAVQLRRYAWSANMPLGLLTDFEEFAVYDCRVEPKASDDPGTALLIYMRFDEYEARWDEISSLFSRDSVVDGSLQSFARSSARIPGTRTVDDAFLRRISEWRGELATDLATRNALSQRELNFAVQLTIDRIVFLRIAEDRGTETYGGLADAAEKGDPYEALLELFQAADDRYNSGLFHFSSERNRNSDHDQLTPTLQVSAALIRKIVSSLYFPESPYEFSVLPVEVLGQIYEQFLGSTITLADATTAVVEEKPEVRKAGGVYYTPSHVVDFMVEQTVGAYLKGKRPGPRGGSSKVTIVDPACGSGSFLLGAFQYLLDWHRDQYLADGAGRHTERIYQGEGGRWHLTIDEKKRILLNNIYGVDVDPQAVEVTKLSLMLKVLEGETEGALSRQMALFNERVLPDLEKNIQCGNSLVGPDFLTANQLSLMDDDDFHRINIFDWREAFPSVFARGGFDVVVGNPPYIDSEWMTKYRAEERTYCTEKYASASGNWDLFCVFIEKAMGIGANGGLVSLIVPNKLGSAAYAKQARNLLGRVNRLLAIRDYSSVDVFPVAVYPVVFVAQKVAPGRTSVEYQRMERSPNGLISIASRSKLKYSEHFGANRHTWAIFSDVNSSGLLAKLAAHPVLGDVSDVSGAATVAEAYEWKDLLSDLNGSEQMPPGAFKFLNSGMIDRYESHWGAKSCRYLGESYQRPILTASSFAQLKSRRRGQSKSPKIVIAGMTKHIECYGDNDCEIVAGKSTTVVSDTKEPLGYVLGLMNSRLIDYYYAQVFGGDRLQGGYLRVGPPQIRTIPIRCFENGTQADRALRDQITKNAWKASDLRIQRRRSRIDSDRRVVDAQLIAIEGRINSAVYELYGLTPAEIADVDASFA